MKEKFENYQCPNCGYDQFYTIVSMKKYYTFNVTDSKIEFDYEEYADNNTEIKLYYDDTGSKLYCCNCDSVINERETEKQNKIVLEK